MTMLIGETSKLCYLFRGVSSHLYKEKEGRLEPKEHIPFKHVFRMDEGLTMADGAILGYSTKNAVIRHQLRRKGLPTSGISTTPFYEQAKFYATGGGKYSSGYIYKIERKALASNGVEEFIVSDYTNSPSVPEDQEVILVAKDFGVLPSSIVDEIISVKMH